MVLGIPGRVGSILRVAYYRARGARIGPGVIIDIGAAIDQPNLVRIGADSWIDRYAILIAGRPRPGRETRYAGEDDPHLLGRIEIGTKCHIGPHTVLSGIGGLLIGDEVTVSAGSKIYSVSHHYRSWQRPEDRSVAFGSQVSPERQSMLEGPIRVGRNVGIGVDCLLLPGTTIGEDSFVRPASLVGGSWPPNSVLSGRPATREGDRYRSSPA